ncbi:phage regulatory CII family protein [Erwinia pyri]|uniref:Phage regulatory CII family protein n=1 Tax=Erwinia pyri TaxID=3062598 RepID=A0AA50HR58_9GAMM|nr:phage regulatory CII family protein [Erwinia sp. DE2]WLS79715.1 phage regulatory CII family protein [Erwinia sp. DE2]
MFDFQVSKYPHFDNACRAFALRHNLTDVALAAGMNIQMLRNKLNPDQKNQLTCGDLMRLTDVTEDAGLLDALLAQMHCLPSVPVNEMTADKLDVYALRATAEVGQLAAFAASGAKMTPGCKSALVSSINSGVRYLSLAALAIQARIHSNPTLSSTVDAVSGLTASIGLS